MPELYQSLEWHDSTLCGVERNAGGLVLHLRPAYVHKWEPVNGEWIGEGLAQDLNVTILNGEASGSIPASRLKISGADLRISGRDVVELLPVGQTTTGHIDLRLILATGSELSIAGAALAVEVVGGPCFVEFLPNEFAPSESPA
jgi:hypothetical protein